MYIVGHSLIWVREVSLQLVASPALISSSGPAQQLRGHPSFLELSNVPFLFTLDVVLAHSPRSEHSSERGPRDYSEEVCS